MRPSPRQRSLKPLVLIFLSPRGGSPPNFGAGPPGYRFTVKTENYIYSSYEIYRPFPKKISCRTGVLEGKEIEILQVDEKSSQKFLQADRTLDVCTSLVIVQLAIVHHKHEVSIQHLLRPVVITLANSFVNRR